MPTQTQSPIKLTRGLLSVGLLCTGIFSFGSLTLVQTNAAQAHLADASCINKGRPFFFENCWWQKKSCRHGGRNPWGGVVTQKTSCPDLPNLRTFNPTLLPSSRTNSLNRIVPNKYNKYRVR